MASLEEFKIAIQTLQNIREAGKIGRFQFTKSEIDSINFAVEFMEKSIEE